MIPAIDETINSLKATLIKRSEGPASEELSAAYDTHRKVLASTQYWSQCPAFVREATLLEEAFDEMRSNGRSGSGSYQARREFVRDQFRPLILATEKPAAEVVQDRYKLDNSPIGSGAEGEVYKAWDTVLERHVAVKLFFPSVEAVDPSAAKRLAKSLAQNTPGTVAVYDLCEFSKNGRTTVGVVMEWVEGQTLHQRLKNTVSAPEFTVWMQELLVAVRARHEIDLVHGDLRAPNIMVGKSGIKVIDPMLGKSAASRPSVLDRSKDDDCGRLLDLARSMAKQVHGEYFNGLVNILNMLNAATVDFDNFQRAIDDCRKLVEGGPNVASEKIDRWPMNIAKVEEIKHDLLRQTLLHIAELISEHPGQAAVSLAGLYEGVRIHVTRKYRASVGSTVIGNEQFLPSKTSAAAKTVFPDHAHLWQEPVLAQDKHQAPSLAKLRMPMTESALLVRWASKYSLPHSEPIHASTAELQKAHSALVSAILDLQLTEGGMMDEMLLTPPEFNTDTANDDGFLDVLIAFNRSTEEVGEIAMRLGGAMAHFTEKSTLNTLELRDFASGKSQGSPLQAKQMIAKMADDMVVFTDCIEVELPLLRKAMHRTIQQLIDGTPVLVQVDIRHAHDAHQSAVVLRASIEGARGSIVEFRDNIESLPPMTKELTIAKRRLKKAMGDLIEEFDSSLRLLGTAILSIPSAPRT